MVSSRRKAQDREDSRPFILGLANLIALLKGPPHRLLPTADVGLDLNQDDRAGSGQSDVGRGPRSARNSRLDLGPPSAMPSRQEPLDDPGMGGVMEHGRGTRIDIDPEIRPESDGRAAPDLEPDRWTSCLELTDHGSGHADDPGEGGLRNAQA